MTEQLDTRYEAHEALSAAIADFGPRVLSDPQMLRARMSDLLPDLPKERELLVTAAEADVVGELTRHVREHRLDPDIAVQLAAGSLSDRKSIDPASSMWVTTEYAQALGYSVRPGVMSPPPPSRETVTAYGQYGSSYAQTQGPAGGDVSTSVPPQGLPPWVATTPGPKRRNRGLIYGLGAGAAAVLIFAGVALGAGLFKSGPITSTITTTITGTGTGTGTLNLATRAESDNFIGYLSPLGAITGYETLTFTFTSASTYSYTGTRTIVTANGDKVFSTIEGSGTSVTSTTSHATETDTITGGTGRFTGASGTYTDTISSVFSVTANIETFHTTWTTHGTIRY